MGWKFVPSHSGCLVNQGSFIDFGNRQDAREGGETPPLPRNCERPCTAPVVLGDGNGRISARNRFAAREATPRKPLEASRYSSLGITVDRKHEPKWIFPQEKSHLARPSIRLHKFLNCSKGLPLGRWLKQAQVRRPVLGAKPRLRSEGNEGAF